MSSGDVMRGLTRRLLEWFLVFWFIIYKYIYFFEYFCFVSFLAIFMSFSWYHESTALGYHL